MEGKRSVAKIDYRFIMKWHQESMVWDGKRRTFQWAGPDKDSMEANVLYPLAIVFHGSSSSASSMLGLGLESWVTQCQAGLVLPNGVGGGWNDGRPRRAESTGYADDVGFVKAVTQWMSSRFPVNQKQILGAGFSNGAMLCQRLAIESPDLFLALASVCGALPTALNVSQLEKSIPVAQYIYLGGRDTVIGNEFSDRFQWGEILTAKGTFERWKEIWTLQGLRWVDVDRVYFTADRSASALSEMGVRSECGLELSLAYWPDGDHSWPSDQAMCWLDSSGQRISLADRIWAFFERQMNL